MKGFLFLLFTISLLIMIQIQTGALGNETTRSPRITTTTTTTTTDPPLGNRRTKSAAPALSSLGSGSVLLFLINTLIQLFHLS